MPMPAATLERPGKELPGRRPKPVAVENGSVMLHPTEMEVGRFYFVEVNDSPYIYQRLPSGEIEVYGLTD